MRLLERLESRPPFDGVPREVGGRPFDPSDGLDLAEAALAALVLSPALRAARADAAVLGVAAAASPGLPNPTLDVGAQGVLASVPDPWKLTVGVRFAIPLSNRRDAETRHWEARHREALWNVVALERQHERRVRRQWARWSAHLERASLLRDHLSALASLRESAARLTHVGELSPAGLALLDARRRSVARDLETAEADAERASLTLRRLIGVRADAPLTLNPSLDQAAPAEAALTATDLPEVRAAQARADVASAEAERAAAEASPELSVGPTFEHDRGQSAVGAVVSAPLPVFDRNARGRAEAAAQEEAAAVRVEVAVQVAQTSLALSKADVEAARLRLEQAREASAEIHVLLERVRTLAGSGEVESWVVRDALQEVFEARMAELNARLDAAIAAADLATFTRLGETER